MFTLALVVMFTTKFVAILVVATVVCVLLNIAQQATKSTSSQSKGKKINKKVLVVEDTPENIAAAKDFFSQVDGFDFLFAINRKEAESLIHEVDALLTDRSLPFQREDTINSYRNCPSEDYGYVLEANGYDLLAQAVAKGIPCLMFSNHGDSNFFITIPFIEKESCKKILNSKTDDYDTKHRQDLRCAINQFCEREHLEDGMSKEKLNSWKSAWERLFQQLTEKSKQSIA
ncbi:MAG: hypothetical protein Athens071416_262 [Parcubacteria group bacterium Athens0714_16]|nr:MAG: hypothetical protein Athens071416_262 [Parcubacteria group bacterium Athens0714_16]